jgi:hypothetical protein
LRRDKEELKMSARNAKQLALALGILTIVIGCATARKDLVESGTVTIQRVDSKAVYLSGVAVVEKEDHIVVSGWVKRHYGWSLGDGHVDIAVLNPQQETIEKISTDYTPGVIPRRKSRRSHFKVELPLRNLERGSSVWVGFHRVDTRPGPGVFDCGENIAVPHGADA